MNKLQAELLLRQPTFKWKGTQYRVYCHCRPKRRKGELGDWVNTGWEEIFGKLESPMALFGRCKKCDKYKWIEEVK